MKNFESLSSAIDCINRGQFWAGFVNSLLLLMITPISVYIVVQIDLKGHCGLISFIWPIILAVLIPINIAGQSHL